MDSYKIYFIYEGVTIEILCSGKGKMDKMFKNLV